MATHAVTLHLPDDLYRRIAHLSRLTNSPLEGLIARVLSSSLPPLPDDFALETRDALLALERLSDRKLSALQTATLSEQDYARLSALRERRAEGELTPDEQAEMERLFQAADRLTLQKGYAAVLLKWRGDSSAAPAQL